MADVAARPDRFVSVDTSELIAEGSVCTKDFRKRYAHLHNALPGLAGGGSVIGTTGAAPDDGLPPKMTGDELRQLAFEDEASGVWVGRAGGWGAKDWPRTLPPELGGRTSRRGRSRGDAKRA
jgi:hypothetical protein